jgi:hypothetical protein
MIRPKMLVVCVVAALALFVGNAWAEDAPGTIPADVLRLDYFSNANTSGAPDATVRFVNAGTTYATLCEDIFVFDPSEEMSECCSCPVTPNDLRKLSVNSDLTANPLTGVTLTSGSITMVSAAQSGGSCPLPTSGISPKATVRPWVTHIQDTKYTMTESNSPSAALSTGELNALESQCNSIYQVGSGKGICTCGTGQ